MQRTISVMVGKGSVNHNTRKFHAENTDPDRCHLNQSYCNENIKDVYHELFDDAVVRYNAKQTRNDRMIVNYYEKIRSGKQEKSFHEIILQIGNLDDMNAQTEDGELAAKVLSEYMQNFQERNPNLRVFSAHLHMDEATPHLHIDFVPYTTGSTRGLDTRISLKQALAAQGFIGGSRRETEWSQWVLSEKQQLASVMERHDIQWEQKGTHEKHLSVLEFQKKARAEEIEQMETQIEDLDEVVEDKTKAVDKVQDRLEKLENRKAGITLNMDKYDNGKEWQLPEPKPLMYAQAYRTKFVEPFISKLKDVIRSLIAKCLRLSDNIKSLKSKLSDANEKIGNLTDNLKSVNAHNTELKGYVKEYICVRKSLGDTQVNEILAREKAAELALKQKVAEQAQKEKAENQALKRSIRSKSSYER